MVKCNSTRSCQFSSSIHLYPVVPPTFPLGDFRIIPGFSVLLYGIRIAALNSWAVPRSVPHHVILSVSTLCIDSPSCFTTLFQAPRKVTYYIFDRSCHNPSIRFCSSLPPHFAIPEGSPVMSMHIPPSTDSGRIATVSTML